MVKQSREHSPLRVGVIGYGYWGPNIVRNFHNCGGSTVVAVCDQSPTALERVAAMYPAMTVTENPDDIFDNADVDAVAIVTPISFHYPLTRRALESGKHVFVEKPFTARAAEAQELIDIAGRGNLTVMVDHTFLFTGAVRKIRELIDMDELGSLYYYDSTRVNLGMFQHDANVVWDLATHDLAIIDYLLPGDAEAVVATGERHVNGAEDMAFITIYFSGNVIAHLNVNWLSPVKVRTTLIGGEKKMLVWDDLEADEKIKVYDKGVDRPSDGPGYDLRVNYRAGDMWAPRIEPIEALALEVQHFVDCIASGEAPINDGHAGLRVVRMLEAIDEAISHRGRMVYCKTADTTPAKLPGGSRERLVPYGNGARNSVKPVR